MATQEQIGSHEVQMVITVTLLVATSLLALLCDVLRFRMGNAMAPAANALPATLKTAIEPTLVPEIEISYTPEVPKLNRASRLAVALKQPRRVVSADVQAIIERNSQFE